MNSDDLVCFDGYVDESCIIVAETSGPSREDPARLAHSSFEADRLEALAKAAIVAEPGAAVTV